MALDEVGPLEALETLRLKTPAAAVLVLTAAGDEAAGAVAIHAGAEDHLVRGSIADGLLPRAVRYAVDRRRLRRELATIDERTRLPNLRGFVAIAEHQLRMADRAGTPVVLLFVRFEAADATSQGTQGSDDLAVDAAEVLISAIRDADLPARIAEDTFCVLLSGDARGAEVAVLSRLVEAIAVHDARAPTRGRWPCRWGARSTTPPIRPGSRTCSGGGGRLAPALIRAPMTREYLPRPSGRTGGGDHERIDDDRQGAETPMRSIDPAGPRDEDLLRRVGAGDEQAFRELFSRYAAVAHALAFRFVRQAQVAEEIVQEAFLAVWRNPDRYDGDRGSVRSWLMGTVHHRAVDAVRREQAQRRRAEQAAGLGPRVVEDPIDDVLAAIDLPSERKLVRSALGELPDEQREVIQRMYFDGLSQSQIAERTGLPLGTVKSRTLLAMRRLRASIGEEQRWSATTR